jgi:radical SAM-linked protein
MVFGIGGDLRFISHHDTLRMFRRALARAELPVRFSEGFNPHPRVSILLPRPVGISSEDEALIVEFDRDVDDDETLSRLAAQMPADVELKSVRRLAGRELPQPDAVSYRLQLGQADPEWARKVAVISSSPELIVERLLPRGARRNMNIRPWLGALRVDGDHLLFTLLVTADGSARPAEVASLLGFDQKTINHRIHRVEVRWK